MDMLASILFGIHQLGQIRNNLTCYSALNFCVYALEFYYRKIARWIDREETAESSCLFTCSHFTIALLSIHKPCLRE
ncbi:hypothetical protein M0804_006824 [Polistes exclamans]|nr:hypothetical protein M0804_006824 [Polistes exclamans]